MQKDFWVSVQRVATELIRCQGKGERGNIKAVELLCQRAIASTLSFPSDTFILCAKRVAALRFYAWEAAQCLKRWEMCVWLEKME